jgi:hypothetical protein
LRRVVAEQLSAVINRAVAVAVEDEEGVVRAGGGPADALGRTVRLEVEVDTRSSIGKSKAVASDVDEDGAAAAGVELRVRLDALAGDGVNPACAGVNILRSHPRLQAASSSIAPAIRPLICFDLYSFS